MKIVGADPPSAAQVRERHDRILDRLRQSAERSGHDPDRLRIVAVTKGLPADVAHTAIEAGLRLLGESRVQEAEPKVAAMPAAEWHFIGRLQSNKARRAVRAFAAIHSLDSIELVRRVAELAVDEGRTPQLLLQINISGESAKAGLAAENALDSDAVDALRDAKVAGLMTIAPMGVADDEARAVFRQLRELRDRLAQATGIGLPELSMGMSADAEAAAAEGATLVRIGTAIFGPRP